MHSIWWSVVWPIFPNILGLDGAPGGAIDKQMSNIKYVYSVQRYCLEFFLGVLFTADLLFVIF